MSRGPEYDRLLDQEKLIFDASEVIAELMHKQKVSKAEMSRRLGKSRAFVTQVMAGERNMTLRTLADFAHVLGYELTVKPKRKK